MSFCPEDGHEFPLPPTARHGQLVCCPQCLRPLRFEKAADETPLPFLIPLHPDKLTLAERNGYEQVKEQIMQQRLDKASSERRIIQ